jgi:hypothetical protein
VTETSDVPLYTDNKDKPLFTETPEEREFELRAAVGSYWTGGRLLIGMFTFLFASLAFAPHPPASGGPSSPSSWPRPCLPSTVSGG